MSVMFMKRGELIPGNDAFGDTCTIYADQFERLNNEQINYLTGIGITKLCVYTSAMDGYIPLTEDGKCEPIEHFSVNDKVGPIIIAVILFLLFIILINVFSCENITYRDD